MLYSFIAKLKKECSTHFPKLSEHNPKSTKEYAYECTVKIF